MHVTHLSLRNVRCFSSFDLAINNRLLVIEGANGSGKSTIVEALYFACYLKSFRTHRVVDMVRNDDAGSFFIKINGIGNDGDDYSIQIGFEEGVKKIKVNDAAIATYKELMDYYQVVAVSEHDLRILQEGPEERRSFINQFCILQDQKNIDLLRQYKHINAQRTQLLVTYQGMSEQYVIWSEQLWATSTVIRRARGDALAALEQEIKLLITEFSLDIPRISFAYKAKGGIENVFELFWKRYAQTGLPTEISQRRSLFGAHLDDIVVLWGEQNARLYASRGQQKLIVLLIKCAMIRVLQRQAYQSNSSRTLLFLLDDFITDLDQKIISAVLLMARSLGCSVVVTCPLYGMVTFLDDFQLLTLPIE